MSRSTASKRPTRGLRLQATVQPLEPRALMTVSGSLDPKFNGGFYLSSVNPGVGTGLTNLDLVQVESDGSVVAAGPVGQTGSQSFGLIEVGSNGKLDTTFGTNGEADVALPAGLTDASGPTSLLIQPNGQIVVVGAATTTVGSATDNLAVVARFNANGQADTTFGTNGIATIDLTSLGLTGGSLPYASLQSNGSIVLAGTSQIAGTTPAEGQIAAIRLLATGAIDTSFGTNGVVTISNIATSSVGTSPTESTDGLAIEPDGEIVILAAISSTESGATAYLPELIGLNTDGSRDTTLSQAGIIASKITEPYANGLIAQPNGQLLIFGQIPSYNLELDSAEVARVNADGSFDTETFDLLINPYYPGPPSFALQPNGDVVVATSSDSILGPAVVTAIDVFRFTPSLVPDDSFNQQDDSKGSTPGLSQLFVTSNLDSYIAPQGVAVSPENQIVLVGSNAGSQTTVINPDAETSSTAAASTSTTPATDYAVIRLTANSSAVAGDYTGDGVSDPAVYLPTSGAFAIRPSTGGVDEIIPFGIAGAGQTIPVPGNYTGSGVEEIGAYLPSQGVYAYRPSTGGPDVIQAFGIPGAGQSIPAPGDYLGTGQTDLAVYMPSIGSFGIRNPNGGPDEIIQFGISGAGQSIPAPGDYFGTGQTDIAVYLPSIGAFAIRNPAGGPDEISPFGIPGAGNSIPIPGDYDGSGKTELAVYLPKLGEFAYRPANGGPDVIVPFGTPNDGSLPVPGDYDGSGKTEIAIYDPNYGSFAYRPADGGPDVIFAFGSPGVGQSIPTATLPGALPEFNGVTPVTVSAESVAPTIGLAVPSGPTSKRISLLAVNQGDSDSNNGPL